MNFYLKFIEINREIHTESQQHRMYIEIYIEIHIERPLDCIDILSNNHCILLLQISSKILSTFYRIALNFDIKNHIERLSNFRRLSWFHPGFWYINPHYHVLGSNYIYFFYLGTKKKKNTN